MIGRNFIVEKAETLFRKQSKSFSWKFLTVTEKSSKNRNGFTQLWRHWPRLLKVKIRLASYSFSQYRSYTDFNIKLDGLKKGLNPKWLKIRV